MVIIGNAKSTMPIEENSSKEKHIHDLILKNDDIKKDLLSLLRLEEDLSKLQLIHEDKYLNGIYADFTLVYNDKIRAIIECKSGDIGVTDYVRGIGQVLQYEYFNEHCISNKGWQYDSSFNSILLIPSSVFKNKTFNIGRFKYPNSNLLFELNEVSNIVRHISKEELLKLSLVNEENLTSISQYYVRDNRFFEIYALLKYITVLKLKGARRINRLEIELQLKQTKAINNGNWRNAWITASSFRLIDSNNLPVSKAVKMIDMAFEDFLVLIYKSYIKPYVDLLISYFKEDPRNLNKSLSEINLDLRKQFSNRDILYLTQSKTRYLSSWLNLMRDDFGCIDFAPKSKERTFIYDPSVLNESALRTKIKTHSIDYRFLNNFNTIL